MHNIMSLKVKKYMITQSHMIFIFMVVKLLEYSDDCHFEKKSPFSTSPSDLSDKQ